MGRKQPGEQAHVKSEPHSSGLVCRWRFGRIWLLILKFSLQGLIQISLFLLPAVFEVEGPQEPCMFSPGVSPGSARSLCAGQHLSPGGDWHQDVEIGLGLGLVSPVWGFAPLTPALGTGTVPGV